MSKNGLHRHYDRLTPEERFRLDVLAMARGDERESEKLTNTCPRRDYIMNDWGFVSRWETARELTMLTYMDFGKCLDKIQMIEAFRVAFPYLRTVWEDDTFWAYFDGHEAGSRHAWRKAPAKRETRQATRTMRTSGWRGWTPHQRRMCASGPPKWRR